MSCHGCRVLRKRCGESCVLRPCLDWIESPEAKARATLFVSKFFGRGDLFSFISSVPTHKRNALFQSLLFEAVGRTVNPVNGAVGLLGTGNWQLCQSAVASVLRGGTIQAMPELFSVTVRTQDGDRLVPHDLEFGLNGRSLGREVKRSSVNGDESSDRWTKKLKTTTSLEVSETTTLESGIDSACSETKLLHLFL